MYQEIASALHAERPPPCIGCRHYARCASELLACVLFHAFCNGSSKMIGAAKKRGESPHEPSRERYDRVFADDT